MYRIKFQKSFTKDLKKIPREVQMVFANKWMPRLREDPYIGKRFSGKNLQKFFKLAFRHKKNDYRVVYQIKKKEVLIVLLAIGSRENFYKKLDRKKL